MDKNRIEKEKYVVDEMIKLYCHKKHHTLKDELCNDCKNLSNYCHYRLSLCPFKDNKTFCSNCKIHCYQKEYREKIKKVMSFSGPRMIFFHPIIACKHLIETKNERRRIKKHEKKQTS